MNLLFDTENFRNECNNQDRLVRRYGVVRARLIRQRLDELFNAEVLEDIRSLPHVAVHALVEGDLAVEVGKPMWLAFRPEPGGNHSAQGWKKIDSITILGVVEADEKRSPKPV
jgi:hypothetical protein